MKKHEKNGSIWSITTGEEEKDKQILSSKVVYLKIPKGKNYFEKNYQFVLENWIKIV